MGKNPTKADSKFTGRQGQNPSMIPQQIQGGIPGNMSICKGKEIKIGDDYVLENS